MGAGISLWSTGDCPEGALSPIWLQPLAGRGSSVSDETRSRCARNAGRARLGGSKR
jgi:hypothetical protein